MRIRIHITIILIVLAAVVGGVLGAIWAGGKSSPTTAVAVSQPASPITANTQPDEHGIYHAYPGNNIQDLIELAAKDPRNKTVRVHSGTYRPFQHGQAMIWFNHAHDGITLEADGEVILTAANPSIADSSLETYPAVVNHVIYFGDGISRSTVLRGFKITGANNFATRDLLPGPIQPYCEHPDLREKDNVYYKDGGGIKIWGRSYPLIDRVEIYDNYTSPCGAALSVQNLGFTDNAPLIRNSIFRNNRSQITGSAIDLFGTGNALELENCLFVGNISNRGINFFVFPRSSVFEQNGSGALTVFPKSRVRMERCTFTGNYNGVDDMATGNVYRDCIFWKNDSKGGTAPLGRYEMDVGQAKVVNCYFGGGTTIHDLRNTIDRTKNTFAAPDPLFDAHFVPHAKEYEKVGYRPVAP